MTFDEDRRDLRRHEEEIAEHQSFSYALLDAQGTVLLGCGYVDPPERAGAGGEISWWVVGELAGSPDEHALDAAVPRWIGLARTARASFTVTAWTGRPKSSTSSGTPRSR
jgi:hypothetical protein